LTIFSFAALNLKRFQRFTRGGEFFFDAPAGDGTNEGGAAKPAAAAPAEAAVPAAIDYKAKLLALLGLDETSDEATVDAKISEISTAMGSMGDLQTKASTADQLQKQYDDLQLQYQELNKKQEEIWKAKQAAEADEILKVYEGYFVDDASKAAIRNILLSDKEAGIAILNGLKKPEAAAPAGDETKTPPPPIHDPKGDAQQQMSDQEKIDKQNALIKQIQGEGKFKSYDDARAEARRRDSSLFS
jgi:hypothetical protein